MNVRRPATRSMRRLWPVILLAALFILVAAMTERRGSDAGAVLVGMDGGLVVAYAIGRLRTRTRSRPQRAVIRSDRVPGRHERRPWQAPRSLRV